MKPQKCVSQFELIRYVDKFAFQTEKEEQIKIFNGTKNAKTAEVMEIDVLLTDSFRFDKMWEDLNSAGED